MSKLLTAFNLLLVATISMAQTIDNSRHQHTYQLQIKKAAGEIKVDGELNEASWQQAAVANNFWQKFPTDTAEARRQTTAMLTYDNTYLYVGFICRDTNHYVIQSLKRDSDPGDSDGVGVVLDPLNNRSNGFFFAVNPYNVQSDDLLSSFGDGELTFSWDNKWVSQTKRYDDKWMVEIAIPFKTLRYAAGKTTWGINFVRADLKNNEYSTWTKIPVNLNFSDFGYTGALKWDVAPPSPGTNISFIPYTTGGISRNKESNEKVKGTFNAGFDAKIALSSKMNLDLTVNPDFSQVEVDRQVTNLTRFNIFFPERRTFFLENADMYANYGIPPIRPFYSRTIGLDKKGNRIPIIAGARLSGNLDEKTRIAVMNVQTAKKGDFAAQNYSAISVSRGFLKRSFLKGYFLNREGFLTSQQKIDNPLDRYGRNAGFEVAYNSNDNKWIGWYGYHNSMKFNVKDKNTFMYGGGGYQSRKFTTFINCDNVGVNYYTDMGFVQRIENYDAVRDTNIRLGFRDIFNFSSYTILPKKGKINSHQFQMETNIIWFANGSFNERNNFFSYDINFKSTAQLSTGISSNDTRLIYPTEFTDYTPLPPGTYKYNNYTISYRSDSRKKFVYKLGFTMGDFYNGTLRQFTASVKYRAQPWGNFSVDFEQNDLKFPHPYGNATLFLISPRAEINFSNNLFWTTFFQYNTQAENININSRLQWRYKPMSDLFVVYTDNYFDSPFMKNKNRALVFKLNYWLNL